MQRRGASDYDGLDLRIVQQVGVIRGPLDPPQLFGDAAGDALVGVDDSHQIRQRYASSQVGGMETPHPPQSHQAHSHAAVHGRFAPPAPRALAFHQTLLVKATVLLLLPPAVRDEAHTLLLATSDSTGQPLPRLGRNAGRKIYLPIQALPYPNLPRPSPSKSRRPCFSFPARLECANLSPHAIQSSPR